MTATRLPGAAGTSYALLTFTNQSSTACVLTGYPGVSLLDANGRQLGAAATHTPATAATIGLGANQAASTLLADDSTTCQVSSRSVSVRVYAPNLTQARVLPLALPPCSLSVKPVVAGTSPQP